MHERTRVSTGVVLRLKLLPWPVTAPELLLLGVGRLPYVYVGFKEAALEMQSSDTSGIAHRVLHGGNTLSVAPSAGMDVSGLLSRLD